MSVGGHQSVPSFPSWRRWQRFGVPQRDAHIDDEDHPDAPRGGRGRLAELEARGSAGAGAALMGSRAWHEEWGRCGGEEVLRRNKMTEHRRSHCPLNPPS
eukprot:8592776-Pyramimonas_sp.AAC.1